MADLPSRLFTAPGSSRQLGKAVQAQERAELAVFEHQLQARYLAEIERIDAEALSDAVKTALDEELGTLEYGLELAAGSAAKAELVSRLVSIQSKIDAERIAGRFG